MSDFETWWQQEGQEFLYALNTTTDDDIKLVAEFAWKNGAYCAEQAEQPNTQFMEGYRIGLAEMREACAKVCEDYTDNDRGAYTDHEAHGYCCAEAIRVINFEGDTGFRPVSEMVAEHKQDPKKAAAIERAEARKATRAEKIVRPGMYKVPAEQAEQESKCKDHPDAPHGFCRDESITRDRYVCECEFWEPEENKIYTQTELEAAVLAEREACAVLCEDTGMNGAWNGEECAAAIRARNNND